MKGDYRMNRHARRAEKAQNRHNPQISTQLQYQRLEQAHNNYVRLTDNNIDILQKRITDLENTVGSIIDSVRTIHQVVMIKNFSQKRFFDFCADTTGQFMELSSDVKINSLLQFLERQSISDAAYQMMMDKFLDERLGLVVLQRGQEPVVGDFAYLIWEFYENGISRFKSPVPIHYKLGSNAFPVDAQIGKLPLGVPTELPADFAKDYGNPDLAGKSGVLKLTVFSFKKLIAPTQEEQIPLTDEQKEKRLQSWEAQTIE